MTSRNELIEASAGTGKTQALALHLIELLRGGIKPHEIIALTFSRAAAGEIFERFVSLLAESVENNPEDAALLRETIATQHLSQIGTLDGFLMRIVRSFPLELGLCGDLQIMDEYAEGVEKSRVSFSILRKTDAASKRAFADAFEFAMSGENVRSFADSYYAFINKWHNLSLAMPQESAWGDPTAIWQNPPAYLKADEEVLCAAADRIRQTHEAEADRGKLSSAKPGVKPRTPWLDFADFVESFRGGFSSVGGIAKKIVEAPCLFEGDTFEVSFYGKVYALSGESLAAVRLAMLSAIGYCLRKKLALAKGIHGLMSAYEREYGASVRSRGRLVFADVPRLIATLPDDVRSALEYRMDASIRAWALDEFQDTSREQWNALSRLIDEAKQSGGEKSVFVVGDRKQAIYGWRNGDVSIFSRERDSGIYHVEPKNLSYRFGQSIADAVNCVFGGGSIKEHFPRWECPKHECARPEPKGFVQRVESPGKEKEDFIAPVYNALAAVDPAGRGISAAILVRGNDMGELLAGGLRALGMEGVVWEGESAILDTPSLVPFLDLVAIADHPGDTQAYRHFKASPLAAAKYPGGVPEEADVSVEFAREFTARGLVRTFRSLRALLPDDPESAWSAFTEERFTDMLRAAAEFELQMKPGVRLSDFSGFLAAKKKRCIAEPGKIKVMTIHRSKGLGFDYVVLPLYEWKGLRRATTHPLVGNGWVLPDPGEYAAKSVPELASPWLERSDRIEQEELCAYYVAFTRAKRAMTVVLCPEGKTLRFSDIVRKSLPQEIGDREWFKEYSRNAKDSGTGQERGAFAAPPIARGPRAVVRRRLPSTLFHDGMPAGDLFTGAFSTRMAAMRRGEETHREMEAVEWIDAADAKTDLERALVKPEGFVELWRERAYEIVADGTWESGQIDRVVFVRDGGGLRARVYDFKTNRPMRGESTGDFRRRMLQTYAGQMCAYKRAVSALASIPLERVTATLLLVATGEVLETGASER